MEVKMDKKRFWVNVSKTVVFRGQVMVTAEEEWEAQDMAVEVIEDDPHDVCWDHDSTTYDVRYGD